MGGVASSSQDPAYHRADLQPLHEQSQRSYTSVELQTRHVLGSPGGRGVATCSLQQVGAVDACSGDLDEDLVGDRSGRGALRELEAPLGDADYPQRDPRDAASAPIQDEPSA